MSKQLQDKVAIVTGASSGLGKAIAEIFAAEGAKVVLAARRKEVLAEITAAINSKGGVALEVAADVSQEPDVANLFAETKRAFGRVDIVVNNAGVASATPVDEISLQYWNEVLAVNLTGPFLMSREAVKVMKAQSPQGGRIINIGSVSQKTPRPDSHGLHGDQARAARHDAPAHHGRPQIRRRRLDHPSGRDTQQLHGAARAHRPRARAKRQPTTSWPPRMLPALPC